jgi:hypothetical protein
MLLEKSPATKKSEKQEDTLVVVDPAAELQSASVAAASRLNSIRGARVGIVDNAKHMALPFLKELEAILKDEYGVKSFNYFRKENASIPMPAEAMGAMAEQSDAVVHGVADCGSCITWGVHDSIEFEKRGVPAVTVITTGFSLAAKVRARTLNLEDHPIVGVLHPLANKTLADVKVMARQAAAQVVDGLVQSH